MSASGSGQLGALIRRFRLAAGLSQEDLAAHTGLSVRGVSDLERGLRRNPRPETIRMLSEGLNLTESEHAQLLVAARPELLGPSQRPEPAPASAESPAVALPYASTRLVGREQITRDLVSIIVDGEGRLITLTGPGGVGKTRLALEAAHRAAPSFPDGAVFVDLSPVTHAEQVPSAIAQALGIGESGDRPVRETLQVKLRNRRLLLLLDNFEQVIEAAPFAGELRANAPHLHILVTSREALRIRGEEEVVIQPLGLPSEAEASDIDRLAETEAVALFMQTATSVSYGFALTEGNAQAIAEICRRLDGLPLAIELAATRVKHFPPAMLLEHLDRRLPVLTGGPRDLPARQQTLRDTIAWSYDLLSSDEQALFRRLGVFAGGASLTAVEGVGTAAGKLELLSSLSSLVDKSLLRQGRGHDGLPRFTMLETIREFALETLNESGERAATIDGLASYFLRFVESQKGEHVGSYRGLVTNLEPLDEEIENIRLGIEHFTARGDAASCARLFIEMYNYFYVRGLFREGTALGERLLELAGPDRLASRLHGHACCNLAVFKTVLGEEVRGEWIAREGLAILQESPEDADLLPWALVALTFALREQKRYGEALAYAEEAHGASLPLGDASLAAFTRYHMGKLAYLQGDLELAAALLSETLERSRELGPNETSLYSAIHLAAVRVQRGELHEAVTCLKAAEPLRRPAGSGTVWYWLDVVGALAAASGQPLVAVQLFAAYSADASSMGARADWAPWIEEVKAGLRRQLGDAEFDAAWRAGLALTAAEASSMALEVLERIERGAVE